MKTQKHNDSERQDWINNDEGLYNWKRSSGLSMREFIRQNRAEIDAAIDNVTSGSASALLGLRATVATSAEVTKAH